MCTLLGRQLGIKHFPAIGTVVQRTFEGMPPSNSGKWSFSAGSPTKNIVVLVAGGDCNWAGGQPKIYFIFFLNVKSIFLILGPQNTHNKKKMLFVVPTLIWKDHFDPWIEPSSTSTGGCSGNPSAQRSEHQHRHPPLVWKKHRLGMDFWFQVSRLEFFSNERRRRWNAIVFGPKKARQAAQF